MKAIIPGSYWKCQEEKEVEVLFASKQTVVYRHLADMSETGVGIEQFLDHYTVLSPKEITNQNKGV